ncbi:MAG: ATP-dependent DNA ligase [Candidatus Bathyarchaeia archaeon]
MGVSRYEATRMLFKVLADVFEKIEATTKRLEMTDYLVELIKATPKESIGKVAYLTTGTLYPPFMGIELGIADKLCQKAISIATGFREEIVEEDYKKSGDLGKTAEDLLAKKAIKTLFHRPLTLDRVYGTLEKISQAYGSGAQEAKIAHLAGLLSDADPKEARYIVRMALSKLRLGVADMTFLDALAIAFGGGKEYREAIERAYNLTSDIGYVAEILAKGGIDAIRQVKVTFGRPIKPQLAERLSSLEEILEKLGGKCSAEYKYDGLRIQAHIQGSSVILFSRRQENITSQFPDLVDALRNAIRAKEAIVDGECVPVDPNTGDLLPFQVVSQRRGRKYDIEKMIGEIPVVLFLFDALYVDGEDLTLKPYLERRKALEAILQETERIRIAEKIVSEDPKEIEAFFHKAVQEGTEGLVCKAIGPNSLYEAGKRGWLWIKWKRSYRSEMVDTVDLVAVGAFAGRGRRAGSYGALLMAAYNPKDEVFDTVCKLGSGFTDEDLARLPEIFKPFIIDHKPPRVNALIKPDFWLQPTKVLEVIGDEITLSPLHTCGFNAIRQGSGLAIRFPRLVKFREERAPEDATTVDEIIEMYRRQLKRVESET